MLYIHVKHPLAHMTRTSPVQRALLSLRRAITPETLIHTGKAERAVEKRDTVMHVEGEAGRVLQLASFTILNLPTNASPPLPQCARVWGRFNQDSISLFD